MKKYSVQHPTLQKYIKFFWEIKAESMEVDHKIIPVRNIDLKFNLSDTPHFLKKDSVGHQLESIYFSGLQEHYNNAHIVINGNVNVLGICFYPEGFFPFVNIPLSAFKNQTLGANEISFNKVNTIYKKIKEAPDIETRLKILEKELITILNYNILTPDNFRQIFFSLQNYKNANQLGEFCGQNNISKRKLERMFNKYIGISAKTFFSLNRFQNSVNQIFSKDYVKLSDIAYAHDFFDQMHFIKNFKRFTGTTPKKFIHQNNSMLHIGKTG